MTVRIASLNVNGISSKIKQVELWNFVKENDVAILGLQEFNLASIDIPLPNYNIEIAYNGEELGSAVIYNTQLELREVEKSVDGRITKTVFKGISVINVYEHQPGLPADKRNNMYTRDLPSFIPVKSEPVILMGDFNAYLCNTDKPREAIVHKAFKNLIDGAQMKDAFAMKNPGRISYTYIHTLGK